MCRMVVPFVLGALSMLASLAGWHLWEDHGTLHALITIEQQRQAVARPSAVPLPPASVPRGQ